jgi:hypothetical protein
MRILLFSRLSGAVLAFLPIQAFAQISFLSGTALPNGGEIVSYHGGTLLSTNSLSGVSHGVQAYSLGEGGALVAGPSIDLSSVLGGASNIASVSSVLADARGFGVATLIPTATGAADTGRVAIFDTSTGAVLKVFEVGYHPDSVTITPDRTRLLIANEGEFTTLAGESSGARAGSVSVIDLSGVGSVGDIAGLTQARVATYDFANHLAAGVSLAGVRNARLDTLTVKTPDARDVEPEYIAATNTQAYVTLQENNAVATLDLASGTFTRVQSLGTIAQRVDASDRDGPGGGTAANVDDVVHGLPMPDTIKVFTRGGTTYYVTANEGDARIDDGDIGRASTLPIDQTDNGGGDLIYGGGDVTNAGIGRLDILRDQGDLDGDGLIERPTMMGTRSFTVWNAETGSIAFDSGSMIEDYVVANDVATHGINAGNLANFDTRSDAKGPEIEALEFASFNGRDFVFIGAERQNGIFQFDVTDLGNVFISGYYNPVTATDDSGGAFISPESIYFIAAADNPTGKNLVVVGFEGTGGNGSIAVFEVAIPEPSAAAGLAGLGALGLALLRRRRRAAVLSR